MNAWLKLALYSFIGIIIGSFALGIFTSAHQFGGYPGGAKSYLQEENYEHKSMMGRGMGRMNSGMMMKRY